MIMDPHPSAYLALAANHPYLVYASGFSERSASVKAQHMLCHALNQAGCEAYVMSGKTDPLLRTPPIHVMRRSMFRNAGRLPIIVYSEIVTGNPLEEPMAVRWLLNKPGAVVDNWTGSYSRSDMVFYHDESFLIDGLSGTRLHMPADDSDPRLVQDFEVELNRFIDLTQRRAAQLQALAQQLQKNS